MSKLFGLLNIGFLSNLPDETMEPGFGKETCVDSFHKSYQPNCQKTDAFEVKSPGVMTQKHPKFSSSMEEYGNNASFHGLRFVTDPLSSKPRR